MGNNRKHKRFIKRCDLEFALNGQTYRGISKDFSLDGLFIMTDDTLSPDSIIDIVVHLPNGLTSRLRGKVRRVLKTTNKGTLITTFKNGMGVEIIEKDTNYSCFVSSYYLHYTRSLLS